MELKLQAYYMGLKLKWIKQSPFIMMLDAPCKKMVSSHYT